MDHKHHGLDLRKPTHASEHKGLDFRKPVQGGAGGSSPIQRAGGGMSAPKKMKKKGMGY